MHKMQSAQTTFTQAPGGFSQDSLDMTKMIAENIFKDLKSYGLQDKDIVAVSSELLNKLTLDIRSRQHLARHSG